MFIRYMADTGTSAISDMAIEYLHSLLRIAPVRVGSMTAGMSGLWRHYASLLSTPMQGEFANVVCCSPDRWAWNHAVTMPARNGAPAETVRSRVELHTTGVRNILLTGGPGTPEQVSAASKYAALVVPSEELKMLWEMNGVSGALVIPIPVVDHGAMRRAILG